MVPWHPKAPHKSLQPQGICPVNYHATVALMITSLGLETFLSPFKTDVSQIIFGKHFIKEKEKKKETEKIILPSSLLTAETDLWASLTR